ncbi:MAG: hypothetical protein K0Q79_1677 [Flavipsychrobacter sp.]|jgi:hypothetical protein|nr:hypothetical protein [Flavipsychrobacter sp.]
MTNNTGKEKWVDDVLNSLQGMHRIQPGDVYDNVMAKLNRPQAVIRPFPVKHWAVAAILLLALNIGSVIYYRGNSKNAARTTANEHPLAAQFQSSTYNY